MHNQLKLTKESSKGYLCPQSVQLYGRSPMRKQWNDDIKIASKLHGKNNTLKLNCLLSHLTHVGTLIWQPM